MSKKIVFLSLLFTLFLSEWVVLRSESEEDRFSDSEGQSNQVLMYRMLNSTEADPSDILYYRRWKKQRKLTWLSNHKNLMVPGMMDNEDEETY